MPSVEIRKNVHWIGVNDRTTDLFEGMWPIANEGVSYNSYAIKDEKNVLIDLAKGFKTEEFVEMVNHVFDVSTVDYIVVNHTEPDHTGALSLLCRLSPQARILCTPKAADMLNSFYGLKDRIQPVKDGETVDIGSRQLTFYATPFLHWPDTMMTYDGQEGILFSCDAFGGYGALAGSIFDDEWADKSFYAQEALRYYANIVTKYSHMVVRGIEKLTQLNVPLNIIAPSHGLIWRRDPMEIVSLYHKWAMYHAGQSECGATILFGSMYGNTERYMNAVAQGLSAEGVPVDIFDVSRIHSSYILPSVLKYRAVVIGVPTYEAGLFPPAAHVLDVIRRKNIQHKDVALFGSYLWSGGAQRELKDIIDGLKWNLVDAEEFKGGATMADLKQGVEFGKKIAQGLQSRAATEDSSGSSTQT